MKIGQVLLIVAVVGTGVGGALVRSPERQAPSGTGAIGSEPTLAEVRQATERFQDVKSRWPKATSATRTTCARRRR